MRTLRHSSSRFNYRDFPVAAELSLQTVLNCGGQCPLAVATRNTSKAT
jgi:hypothetical protein